MTTEKIKLNLGSIRPVSLRSTGSRREYAARFVTAGRVRGPGDQPARFVIPKEAIKEALGKGLFDGLASFIDHAGFFAYPSLRNLAGVTLDSRWNDTTNSADGVIRMYSGPATDALTQVLDGMIEDAEIGEPVPDVGLSLVFWPKWKPRDNKDDPLELKEFVHVESCDFVFMPAADGRLKEALSAHGQAEGETNQPTGGASMTDQNQNTVEAHPPAQEETPPNRAQEWMSALSTSAAAAMIAGSGLPAASRERLSGQNYETPEEVQAAIDGEREYLARLQEDQVVQIGGDAPRANMQISMGRTGVEQVQLALDALLEGVRPPDGIQPLTGIRELYNLLSGDYELTGLYNPERVYLANVSSSTMAGLVANALNKRVMNLYAEYPRWWDAAVSMEDFSTLQDVRWITLGGVGELPTVSEGAAYTEMTWDDQTETDSFVKKGGYLGLTLEAIDKDDTGQLRAAPRALAQAAWLTLSKSISAIFTTASGTGPTMSDSVVLFHAASHSNLGSSALSPASWRATKIAMMKQTELNSSERLGALVRPYLLWVPVDLEDYATEILGSEGKADTADNNVNVDADGETRTARLERARERVITCPLWTDTDNWAAQADPRLYPSIGLGFRYGRQPEVFSVASPTAGLMFTNDVMPVKVRFFYAVGPIDYRGLYKHNVA